MSSPFTGERVEDEACKVDVGGQTLRRVESRIECESSDCLTNAFSISRCWCNTSQRQEAPGFGEQKEWLTFFFLQNFIALKRILCGSEVWARWPSQ